MNKFQGLFLSQEVIRVDLLVFVCKLLDFVFLIGTLLNKTSVATSKPVSGESSDKETEKSTSKPSEWPR